MVAIESNIDGVIYRMKRRPRDLGEAVRRALTPERWEQALKAEAARTLWALARRAEWPFVEPFLNTILTFLIPMGFAARMSSPLPPALSIEDLMMAKGLQGGGQGPSLFSDFLNQFDQMMAEWVATEKRKDRRDTDKTDEEIGQWIGYLMLTPDAKLSAKASSPGRVSEQEAKRRLMPHIVDFIARRQAQQRLASETVDAWLRAVLASWVSLMRRELPGVVAEEYRAVRAEL